MQFRSFFLVCAVLVCVAESRMFRARIPTPRSRLQQRTAAPTPPVQLENEGPVKPLPTGMPSVPEDSAERDWPYAMMEFSSLVGTCTTVQFMWKMMQNKPSEGILVESCPHVYEAAKRYAEANEEARARAEDFSEEVFHLLQCVNLQAERENLEALTAIPAPFNKPKGPFKTPRGSKPDNMYFKEAEELFEMCEQVFDDAEKYLQNWAINFGKEVPSYERSVKSFLRRTYPKIAERYPHRG